MVGGALYRHNQTPVLWVGDLQTGKQLYRRGSPSWVSIPNPRSGSQPGGPALGGGAPRASAPQASGACVRSSSGQGPASALGGRTGVPVRWAPGMAAAP